MLFGKYCTRINLKKLVWIIAFLITAGLTILWYSFILRNRFHVDTYFPYGNGFNPPSISLITYAILVGFMIYNLEKVVSLNSISLRIFRMISGIGKHTLYIFLYHIICKSFLDIFLTFLFGKNIVITNVFVLCAIYYAFMLFIPIIIEMVIKKSGSLIVKIIAEG